MISSVEYLLNKNLCESAAADNTVANSCFYYSVYIFDCGAFFSSEGWRVKKGRTWGDFLVAVEGYLPRLLR